MTPEERAGRAVRKLFQFVSSGDLCDVQEIIAAAIREAVAEKNAEIERLRAALRTQSLEPSPPSEGQAAKEDQV